MHYWLTFKAPTPSNIKNYFMLFINQKYCVPILVAARSKV
jgi:hypothetical protein